MAFLAAAGLLWAITLSVRYEREALNEVATMVPLMCGLAVIAVGARWFTRTNSKDAAVCFEEEDAAAIQVLGLR
jgi:hypothetical protein